MHRSETSSSCAEAFEECWPAQADQSHCTMCEGKQWTTLHAAGCTQADVDLHCGAPSAPPRCPEPLAASVNATGLLPGEQDAKLAQKKLGQLQHVLDVLPQERMGQLASFGPI
jgi:hypothetical protein